MILVEKGLCFFLKKVQFMSSELISPVAVLPAAASRSLVNFLKAALCKLCQLLLGFLVALITALL